MVFTNGNLVEILRDHCKHAKQRIWIASPFIGEIKDVCKIIDGRWKMPTIQFRVLTDAEAGFIKKSSLLEFEAAEAEIRSLASLHAKVYIVDDWCLISSANLTGTAFSRRYEVGIEANIKEVEPFFVRWWEKSRVIDEVEVNFGDSGELSDYQCGRGPRFPKICDLPPYETDKMDKFMADCEKFKSFAKLYEKVTGRNKQMIKAGFPLLIEVDYFFNFLFHDEAIGCPSNEYRNGVINESVKTEEKREKMILKYFRKMSFDRDFEQYRLENIEKIQTALSPKKIKLLSKYDIEDILKRLHSCLPINRARIVNNNSIEDIQKVWNKLLNENPITSQSVEKIVKEQQIRFFGRSCVSELIALYKPNEYPIINTNSKSGLRFFGIGV